MSDLTRAIRRRKIAINQITDILKNATFAQSDITKVSLFEVMYETLDKYMDDFRLHHNSVIGLLIDDDDFDTEDVIRRDVEGFYYQIQIINREIQGSHSAHDERSKVKLPKITIPIFNGNLSDWPTFYDLFCSLINDNNTLQDIEKFQYLTSFLTDEPLTLLRNIKRTDHNYSIAFKILEKRYQNVRVLATNYWNNIYNATDVRTDNPKALRLLINTFNENLCALNMLKFPTQSWCFVMFNLLIRKIDDDSRLAFEVNFCETDLPKYDELYKFLENRCNAIESSNQTSRAIKSQSSHNNRVRTTNSFVVRTPSDSSSPGKCGVCKQEFHIITQCPEFVSKTPFERFSLAKQLKLCINCLRGLHMIKDCKSIHSCRTCQKRHHSLLHLTFPNKSNESHNFSLSNSSDLNSDEHIASTSNAQSFSNSVSFNTVILSTAIVEIQDRWGNFQKIRAMIDPGSQANIITEKYVNLLGLAKNPNHTQIYGLNQIHNISKFSSTCLIRLVKSSEPRFSFDALILPTICSNIPIQGLEHYNLPHLQNIDFADSEYHKPSPVNLLLGAELFVHYLLSGRIVGKLNEPSALETVFGWIIMGRSLNLKYDSVVLSQCNLTTNFDIKQFWDLEKVPERKFLSTEEEKCEEIYKATYNRNTKGNFIVALPFKVEKPDLGDTYSVALNRFFKLENLLERKCLIYDQYREFIQGQIINEYMVPVKDKHRQGKNYLPHHCVIHPERVTTKLRVVYDGSSKGSKGVSLNDVLFTGPKLQSDLFSILLKIRLFPFVMIADIKLMYFQIFVREDHCDYQRLLWRNHKHETLREYRLNRVPFGLNCSPFLAIRTIHELSNLYSNQYPLASRVLLHNTYVDDVIFGVRTLEEGFETQKEIVEILNKGGFEPRKWASNNPQLLSKLDPSFCQLPLEFPHDFDTEIKVLGLYWNPKTDYFSYSYDAITSKCTKRHILSEIAKIYDPLGFLSPIVLMAKVFLQQLWLLNIDWDERTPEKFSDNWKKFQRELRLLSDFRIPRYILSDQVLSLELHGFSDASEKGYSAAVYLRIESYNKINTHLVISKTKVAPLKTMSIPRLELCGALLLANLLKYIQDIYAGSITINSSFAYSDSTIVLKWISSSPHEHHTFVANRISQIQELIPNIELFHVSSENNPADIASRGAFPGQLVNSKFWFFGPSFLLESSSIRTFTKGKLCEGFEDQLERKLFVFTVSVDDNFLNTLVDRFSSLYKIKRIIFNCLKFLNVLKSGVDFDDDKPLLILIKRYQGLHFSDLIERIIKGQIVPKPYRKLSLFLDKNGFLRVGGRLRNAQIPFNAKHPYLLPRKSRLTTLIIEETHKKLLHPGYTLLQNILRQDFWILSCRRALHEVLSNCLICFKSKPKNYQPYMGDLPSHRISQLKAFVHSSVDYAGPIFITMSKSRGTKRLKAYICIFVCCNTKAIHIELASDLSSEAFLAAFKRFISRRGICKHLHSDCGTNFKGAYQLMKQYSHEACISLNVQWSFNPPSTPHFNGLVEAGVKSVKTQLFKVIGEQIFTYEEMYTLLTQIESLLNSRPLTTISSDPNDLTPLTPGHFLTMEPLSALNFPDYSDLKINTLSRWQLINRLYSDFWKRWHLEYLNSLQQRSKWLKVSDEVRIDTLVIIKDDLKGPHSWVLGRVTKLHPGKDGITRVVTLKTNRGTIQRPLVKLCPLPNQI